jgi:hypothetical protein
MLESSKTISLKYIESQGNMPDNPPMLEMDGFAGVLRSILGGHTINRPETRSAGFYKKSGPTYNQGTGNQMNHVAIDHQ